MDAPKPIRRYEAEEAGEWFAVLLTSVRWGKGSGRKKEIAPHIAMAGAQTHGSQEIRRKTSIAKMKAVERIV